MVAWKTGPTLDLAWCEPVTATALAPHHLRRLEPGETLRTGGGLHGTALCGRGLDSGWDLNQATADDLAPLPERVREWRCPRCLEALATGKAPAESEGAR